MITTHHSGATVTVLLAVRSINPLSRLFQRALGDLLDQLESRRTRLDAILIGFDADGAHRSHELNHLMALTPAQAADCMQMLASYNALLLRLESMGVPVTAMLRGEVSGHALGLALACHRRIALADAQLSLPQAASGLAPVAGEIARTVRLAGLRAAMPLLLEGARLNAGQALQAGLLHAVVADEAELEATIRQRPGAMQPWQAKGYQPPGGDADSAAVRALLHTAPALLRQRAGGAASAAETVLCAMVEGLRVDFPNALRIESRYFCLAALSQASRKGGFPL